jgi:hypothetical protein
MKRTSGNFAAIYFDEKNNPFSVYGTFEIYPANTVGYPLKNYHSGKISCEIKNLDSQMIIKRYAELNLKIVGEKWTIGWEPSLRQGEVLQGEPFDTILSRVRDEYFELNPDG